MTKLKTYLVGGAVRDKLLGLPVKDQDFCVVGSTPEEMLSLGFTQIGKDFPVFLHPETKQEYALARTERKTGVGYTGFTVFADPSVTLEQDLMRRDLTINAIAEDEHGTLFDPRGGIGDLENKVLRHVDTTAFAEDPVRVLRLARFYARYSDFTVAPYTVAIVRSMVDSGALDHLVAERVWAEMKKGLMEDQPQRMFEFLREVGALKVLVPELDALWGVPQPAQHHPEICTGTHVMMVLQQAAKINASLEVRFAALMHDLGKGLTPPEILPSHHGHEEAGVPLVEAVCARFKVPSACRDLAVMVCREHAHVHGIMSMKKTSVLKFLMRVDAFRRPERFQAMLVACECDARGRLGLESRVYPQREYLETALRVVMAVDTSKIAVDYFGAGTLIAQRIYEARVRALKQHEAELLFSPVL